LIDQLYDYNQNEKFRRKSRRNILFDNKNKTHFVQSSNSHLFESGMVVGAGDNNNTRNLPVIMKS